MSKNFESEFWACSQCSYLNNIYSECCEFCGYDTIEMVVYHSNNNFDNDITMIENYHDIHDNNNNNNWNNYGNKQLNDYIASNCNNVDSFNRNDHTNFEGNCQNSNDGRENNYNGHHSNDLNSNDKIKKYDDNSIKVKQQLLKNCAKYAASTNETSAQDKQNNVESKIETNERSEENEEKSDEWTNLSDFVLQEYIQDASNELSIHTLAYYDKAEKIMKFLGIYSATSRSRFFDLVPKIIKQHGNKLIEEMKEKQNLLPFDNINMTGKLAELLEKGNLFEEFICVRCHMKLKIGGIQLRNCQHNICLNCFTELIYINGEKHTIPQCTACAIMINVDDIINHANHDMINSVSEIYYQHSLLNDENYKLCYDKCCDGVNYVDDPTIDEFLCIHCGQQCCMLCKNIHTANYSCKNPTIINNETFHAWWQDAKKKKPSSNEVSITEVVKDSSEWKSVLSHIDYRKNSILKIERIQNEIIWNKYINYCDNLTKNNKMIREICVWHGTRKTDPKVIYEGVGFDKNQARIGSCLWFAVSSSYSMNGFQFTDENTRENKVFLTLVAAGNENDVRFIRDDAILNVFCNEATYPCYIITW